MPLHSFLGALNVGCVLNQRAFYHVEAFLRRLKSRQGAAQAVTATAHKLARIVYLALKHGLAYVRQSQEEYEAKVREQQIKAVKRKARQLGLDVIEKELSEPAPSATEAAAK